MRAVAVLLVVLDHARIGPFHGGFVGVDVFFVISGFLITGLLIGEAQRTHRISLVGFYARRAKRIIPAATLVLAVTAVASYVLLNGITAVRLLKDSVWATFFAANIKFARDETDYWAQDAATSPIQHYWSLAVEEQFYLVWPVVVLLLVWLFRRHGRDRRAIVVTIAVISLASFAYGVRLTGTEPLAAYFSTPARAWELGLGAGVAAALVRVGRLPAALLAAASWAGLVMVGAAAVLFTEGTRVPGVAALLPVVGTALLLGGGVAAASWGPQRLLSVAPMRWVGDRSYSYYLWHWPALILVAAVWRTPSGWSGLLVAAGALVLSDLSYRFVENPFRTATFFKPQLRGIALYPASVALLGLVLWSAHHQVVSDLNDPEPAITTTNFGQENGEEVDFSDDPAVAIVEASVLAAENGQPIPHPLKPDALSLVETDDPVAADLGGCEYFGIPDPMPLCPLGDPDGDKTMVLVGDSHMRHWIPALDKIARQQGYRAYYFVLQGCTPALVQPITPRTDAPDEDCTFFHEWTHEQIVDLRPDLVLMSTDTQFEYVDEQGRRTKDNQEIASLIEQGMVDRIEATRPHAGRIVVIGDVPRLKFDPEVITERGATLEDGLSAPQARSMQMRRAVKAAVDATGVDYVDPKRWFCAYDKCPVVVGDYITHRDRGHMTLEYGRSLAGPLARALGLG
ncbi:acyltransferase family protein [Nocardioides sp.]|uniref:acyltransferase family protein n=1 Tax=Nocardioides sp. TaxID=35761 RepID=UPI00341E33F0